MTTFQPSLHPRSAAGTFAAVPQSAPEVALELSTPIRKNALLLRAPRVAAEWDWSSELNDGATPATTAFSSNNPHAWVCSLGHRWVTMPNRRTSKNGTNCPDCAKVNAWSRHKPKPGQSFYDRSPKEAAEWAYDLNNGVSPWEVTHSSNQAYCFRCAVCAHVWPSPLNSRTRGQGCPPCGRRSMPFAMRRPKPGGSFAERSPAAAAGWDYARNGEVTPDQVKYGSNDLYWFLCMVCANSWQATPHMRSKGDGCRICSNLRLATMYSTPPPGASLGDLFPITSAEWDLGKNDGVTPFGRYPSSNISAWWRCLAKSHSWPATPNSRTGREGSGCPRCAGVGTSKWERDVSHTLSRIGIPVDPNRPKIRAPGRKRAIAADIVVPDWNLVVELDGHYWHGFSDSAVKDARQTAHLVSAGWGVVRVRAQLPASGVDDLVLSAKSPSTQETTVALVTHLASLGYPVPVSAAVSARDFDYDSLDASLSANQLAAVATD